MLGYAFYNSTVNSKEAYEDLKEFIPHLPQIEQQIINYYFVDRMKQNDIARLVGMTQGAVSSRLKRSQNRLVFLKDIQSIDFEDVLNKIKGIVREDFDIEVIRVLIATTCQSEAADRLNSTYQFKGRERMNQVKVRHRFERCMTSLKYLGLEKGNDTYLDCYKKLLMIKNNLYLLHDLKLPHFER